MEKRQQNKGKLRIVFFGTPDFVIPVLRSLNQKFQLVGVVTAPDTYQGRKKVLTFSPVKAAFIELDLEGLVAYPHHLDEDTAEALRKTEPDLFVVAAYGKIIPQSILDLPKYGSINIHPSLLPKYRGPSPIQSAIRNGEAVTGVSIIQLDSEMDHGPILSQWTYEIQQSDTFASLHKLLFDQAAERLPEVINKYIGGELIPASQNHKKAVYCQKITREDGYFDSQKPPTPHELDLMIRAFYPWPTAWTRLPADFGGQAKKGAIIKFLPDRKVQLEGKTEVPLKDFLNGYPSLKQLLMPLFLEK